MPGGSCGSAGQAPELGAPRSQLALVTPPQPYSKKAGRELARPKQTRNRQVPTSAGCAPRSGQAGMAGVHPWSVTWMPHHHKQPRRRHCALPACVPIADSRLHPTCPAHGPDPLTSGGGDVLLQDADVELQGELRGGAQEGLDDRHALEGVAVGGQPAHGVAHLLLHLHRIALPQPPLARDGDVGLLLPPRPAVHHQGLHAPAGTWPPSPRCSPAPHPAPVLRSTRTTRDRQRGGCSLGDTGTVALLGVKGT